MRLQILILTFAALGLDQCSSTAKTADFIKGRYTKTIHGCALDALLRGSTIETPETVPDMMDAKGFTGWERRCEFKKITVEKPGEVWSASMQCVEGKKESMKTFTFSKDVVKNTIDVSAPDQADADTYFFCEVD